MLAAAEINEQYVAQWEAHFASPGFAYMKAQGPLHVGKSFFM